MNQEIEQQRIISESKSNCISNVYNTLIEYIPRIKSNIDPMSYKFRLLTSRNKAQNKTASLYCSISDKSICYKISEQCSISSTQNISHNSHHNYNSNVITTSDSVTQFQLINFPNIEKHFHQGLLVNLNNLIFMINISLQL